MSKKFLEVFPDLNITAEMKELFKLVDVERVSAAGDRSSLRVYINSPRLIHKKYIRDLENGIQDQLFPGKKLTVKIQEKYTLSSQYNPQKLFQAYRDSLLHELKNYSIVEYNILRKGGFPQTAGRRCGPCWPRTPDPIIRRTRSGSMALALREWRCAFLWRTAC